MGATHLWRAASIRLTRGFSWIWGIALYKSGISKLYFAELPKEVQERFQYDPQRATTYSAAQAANYEVYQKQQEEARHRQEDADAQKNAMIAKQQAANDRAQGLQDRELVRDQQKALKEANRPRPEHRQKYTTVLHPLPVVRSPPASPHK